MLFLSCEWEDPHVPWRDECERNNLSVIALQGGSAIFRLSKLYLLYNVDANAPKCATRGKLETPQSKCSTKRKYLKGQGRHSLRKRNLKLNRSLNPSALGHSVEVKQNVCGFVLSGSVPVGDSISFVPKWAR